MAKGTDNFFIRAFVTPDDTDTYQQATIDLGSYVNLGVTKSTALRILNIEGEWVAADGTPPQMDANTASTATWQLCTTSQTGLVRLDNKSVVGKGQMWARNGDSAAAGNSPSIVYSDSHLPQMFTEGYLVAVESLFLGGQAGQDWEAGANLTFSMVMECRLESITQTNAVSLALSQQ